VSVVSLKGMTWSHPRGYDPMVACSAQWWVTRWAKVRAARLLGTDFQKKRVDIGNAYQQACVATRQRFGKLNLIEIARVAVID
jgi:hypothetical protein